MKLEAIFKNKSALLKHSALVTAIALILALISMETLDFRIATWAQDESLSGLHRFAKLITDVGLGAPYFIFILFLYIGLRFVSPRLPQFAHLSNRYMHLKNWSVQFLLSLLISGIYVHLIKNSVGRRRPHVSPELYPFHFSPFSFDWRNQSFPSGHTQVLFCVATMIAVLKPKFAPWIFVVAGLIAFTRVLVLDHYVSDVIFGASVGYVGTLVSLYLFKKKFPLQS